MEYAGIGQSEYTKTFKFGKIAVTSDRKINRAEVTMVLQWECRSRTTTELATVDGYWTLRISGNVWNAKGTEVVRAGQCGYTLNAHLSSNPQFAEIYRLWQAYHLNDLTPGTYYQMKVIAKPGEPLGSTTDEQRLQEAGLYHDRGYRYGASWLVNIIPDDELCRILILMLS